MDTENNGIQPKKQAGRSAEEKKKLINRLNRIEGQIRGLRGMVERDTYCVDILIQSSAAAAALNGFNREVLARHISACVVRDIRNGDESSVEELADLVRKMMK